MEQVRDSAFRFGRSGGDLRRLPRCSQQLVAGDKLILVIISEVFDLFPVGREGVAL